MGEGQISAEEKAELIREREMTMVDEQEQLGLTDKPEDMINRNIFDNMYNKISELVSALPFIYFILRPLWLTAQN